jgi:hypothetical protein
MSLTFFFPSQPIVDYTDLMQLDNKEINLTVAPCEIKIEKEGEIEADIKLLNGSFLNFKRAQLLRVDGIENRVILSGTFNLKFLLNGKPESISDGRFDVGINKDFYSLGD